MSRKEGVSFIDRETFQWMQGEPPKDGLCLKRFHADFIVEGLKARKVGEIIELEGVRYEITKLGKGCYIECGFLKRQGRKCPLADGVAFGKKL